MSRGHCCTREPETKRVAPKEAENSQDNSLGVGGQRKPRLGHLHPDPLQRLFKKDTLNGHNKDLHGTSLTGRARPWGRGPHALAPSSRTVWVLAYHDPSPIWPGLVHKG